MRIVHYLADLRLAAGGVTRAVVDLCLALSQQGHEVVLMTRDAADGAEALRCDSTAPRGCVQLIELARRRGFPVLDRVSRDQAQARLTTSDIIHLHVVWDPVTLQLGRMARRLNRPYVVSVHGMLDDWTMAQKGWKKRLYLAGGGRRLLEGAQAVHFTAEAEAGQAAPWIRRGRPVVIPLVTDLSLYRDLPAPEEARRAFPQLFTGMPVVLFVGRLHPIKRIEMLLQAAAELRALDMACRIAIVGSGEPAYEARLRALAEQLGIAELVHFLGFVTGCRKIALYVAADVLVLPSRHENWGFVLIEALACGTPVITTRHVAIWRELMRSGAAQVADDVADLSEAIRRAVSHAQRWSEQRTAARAWVLRELEAATVASQYVKLYREVIAS